VIFFNHNLLKRKEEEEEKTATICPRKKPIEFKALALHGSDF
jgi:hypothetical protein